MDESEGDIVSSRGRRALKPPLPYLGAFFQALQNPCDVHTNPEGHIALCVAENKLIIDELSARLTQSHVAATAFTDPDNYCYNDMRGMQHTREAIARFLTRKFLKPEKGNDDGAIMIKAEDIIIASGCASLLNGLFFSLCEENEGVLIPAPYYAAFESDMRIVAKCIPLRVGMADPTNGPSIEELEAVYTEASERNITVKMLLLTNPNNPLGTIYSGEVIEKAIIWARTKKIHTVVDEIYGLSVHDKNSSEFQSVTKILNNDLGNDVHFLWALSKDFGSSGFRFGVLYTQNSILNDALGNLNMFSSVSHPVQAVVTELLDDHEFVDTFLDTSRERLKLSYSIVTSALDDMRIEYIPAKAGIFVYCDFSTLLPEQTFEGEAKLSSLIQEGARIVMTPGHSQRENFPGMFRICYAWVNQEVLIVAMIRLKAVVHDIRSSGWDGTYEGKTYYKYG